MTNPDGFSRACEAFMAAVKAAQDKDYNAQDSAFMRDMVKHHEMAVEMSKKVISKGKNKEVSALAKQIIAAQEAEITKMKKWLKDRDGSGGGGMDM